MQQNRQADLKRICIGALSTRAMYCVDLIFNTALAKCDSKFNSILFPIPVTHLTDFKSCNANLFLNNSFTEI